MKLAVVGSRSFSDYDLLCKCLSEYTISEIVSGGARGADSLAERYGNENRIPLRVFLPDWETHGKIAGFIRNRDIVNRADEVIAFWDGKSSGTANTIKLCKDVRKKCRIVMTDTESSEPNNVYTWLDT